MLNAATESSRLKTVDIEYVFIIITRIVPVIVYTEDRERVVQDVKIFEQTHSVILGGWKKIAFRGREYSRSGIWRGVIRSGRD